MHFPFMHLIVRFLPRMFMQSGRPCDLLFIAVLLVAALLVAAPARAVMLPNLFNAVVPVTAQTPEEFARGAATGMEQVLVRLTGRPGVAAEPAIKAALRTADVYLLQFRYDGEGDQGILLNLSFDQPLLEKLLREAKIPLWPADRVPVAVWIVLQDSTGEKTLINADNHQALTAALDDVAVRRGLVLRYPLLDLADATRVDPLVLWDDRDVKTVLAASERYEAGAVLIGRFTQVSVGEGAGANGEGSPATYEGSWQIADSQGEKPLALNANPWDAQADLGVTLAAEMLAARYAIAPVAIAGKGTVVEVTNITTFKAYNALLSSVKAISAVRQVLPESIDGDRVLLRITAEGQLEQLVDALNRVSGLQAEAPAAAVVTDPAVVTVPAVPLAPQILRYRWRG